jgi:hypothetical protein
MLLAVVVVKTNGYSGPSYVHPITIKFPFKEKYMELLVTT